MLETEFKPGEQLKHWAVGTKRAGVKTWVGLFIGMIAATLLLTVLGIRPGLIGTPLWIVLTCAIMAPIARAADKHYAVGISDSRLFGFTLRPKLVSTAIGLEDRTGTFNCPLAEIKDVRARRIVRGTTVRIVGRNLRVVATCPDAAMEGNKEQWAGIVATLQSMTNSSLDAERQDTPPNPGHQADG
jgi:hypothetical protein